MNRSFVKLTAIALAALALLSVAACGEIKPSGGQNADNNTPVAGKTEVPTAEPTPVPTEVPTEAPTPTPEPTATPVPWPTDPSGIIPKEVEIISFVGVMPGRCISRVDGKLMFQIWNKEGLKQECEVPEEFAEVYYIEEDVEDGNIQLYGNLTSDRLGNFLYFYQDTKGRTLYFECTSNFTDSEKLLLATTDGKAIWYQWGDDYYKMHDFGPDAHVEVYATTEFYVNDEWANKDVIKWMKVQI